MNWLRIQYCVAFALGLAFVACKNDKRGAPAASASASVGKAPAKLAANVDPALLGELQGIVQSCKVDAAAATVNCQNGELRSLIGKFSSGERSRVKSIGTFASALKDVRPELRAAATNVLQGAFRLRWGAEATPGSVTTTDADEFLAALAGLAPAQMRQALPAATHVAVLSGRMSAFESTLDKSVPADLRPIAYRYLMTHGGVEQFPRVQALAKSTDTQVVLAALENPRNMGTWTDAERAAICPFAAGFLADARPVVVSKASAVLTTCGGEHVDKLLDVVEASLKAKTLFTARISAFRDLCLPAQRSTPTSPTDAQCDRARKLLVSAVDTKELDAPARGMALVALAYQWPDDKTLSLAKKYEKSSDRALAEQAGRVVQRLNQAKPGKDGKPLVAEPVTPAPTARPASTPTPAARAPSAPRARPATATPAPAPAENTENPY